jgi:negative regulator of flagellin synthesis FlgM
VSKISQLDGGAINSGTHSAVDGVAPAKSVGSGAAGPGNTDPSGTDSSDSVSITESGRALAALSQAVQDSPDINSSRVATLKQAITSGSYTIDDNAIAARMLQIDQDLHGNAR